MHHHVDTDPITARRRVHRDRPLLVVVHDMDDVDGALQDAAGRAWAEGRSLLVAVVAPPAPLTTHPVVHAVHGQLCRDVAKAVSSAARRGRVGLDVEVLPLRASRALTRQRARHALDRRIGELIRRHGAELHPRLADRWDRRRITVAAPARGHAMSELASESGTAPAGDDVPLRAERAQRGSAMSALAIALVPQRPRAVTFPFGPSERSKGVR